MRPALLLLLLAAALPAFAQNADIQKQLMQRQQQSDAFLLQLRQSQETLKVPASARADLEARQLSERQWLENISARQLTEVKPDLPQELRPYERQKAGDERRPFTVPSAAIPAKAAQQPAQLQPAPRGIVQVIEAPR